MKAPATAEALFALLLLAACSDADVVQSPSAGGSPEGPPPGGQPAGEPGAAPGEGGPPPAPGPPPAKLDEPGTPATIQGATVDWIAGESGQPLAMMGVRDENQTIVMVWNRVTGETNVMPAIWPVDTVCAVAGALICVCDGRWRVFPFAAGGAEPPMTGKAPTRPTEIAVSPGGWIALVGDPLVIVDPAGKVAWSEPGAPTAAGWFGDTLWYARDGLVREVEPVDGSVREVGALPATADSWKVAPDGTWVARQGQTLLLFGPGLIGMTDVKPPMVKLPPATSWYGWLDRDHLVVTTPAGLHLWERRQPVNLTGDLTKDPSPETLRPFAP